VASKTERAVVNAAGLVQGIVLVTFPAASTIFTGKSEYGCTAIVAAALGLLSFIVVPVRSGPARAFAGAGRGGAVPRG
jgi:hypothetical protein